MTLLIYLLLVNVAGYIIPGLNMDVLIVVGVIAWFAHLLAK